MEEPARFISPPIKDLKNLRQPLTPGEEIVLGYFNKNLPTEWDIYIQPHMNGLRPDFVLMSPSKGIAVFEVKDWDFSALNYSYKKLGNGPPILIGNDGQKNFSLSKIDPFLKIKLYKEEIYHLYCPSLPDNTGYGIIFNGVIFPFANRKEVNKLIEPFHENLRRQTIVISSEDLQENNIKKVLNFIHLNDSRMTREIYNDFKPWLIEPEFSSEQRIYLINELDAKQKELALTRTETGKRRIRGPAGSGKSMVLCSRAAKLASENKNVLIVTYNITLINYLLDLAVRFEMNGKVRNQITALNFHQLCKRLANENGHGEEYSLMWKDPESHDEVLELGLAKQTLSWIEDLDEEDKYDGIFVDEGQDFEQGWLDVITKLVKKNGELLLCVDQAQNVYGKKVVSDELMVINGFGTKWFNLINSYRLPLSVCKLASKFVENFFPDAENLRPIPKQDEIEFNTILKWRQCEVENITNETLNELLGIISDSKNSVAYANLTCIVQTEKSGKELIKALRSKNIKCIDTFSEKQGGSRRKKMAFFKGDARVKVTTIHSFKGWESSSIVVQFTKIRSVDSLSLFYTAITRIKKSDTGCHLTVVNSAPELKFYGKGWPDFKNL